MEGTTALETPAPAESEDCISTDEYPQITIADCTGGYTVISRDDHAFLQVLEAELVSPDSCAVTLADIQEASNHHPSNLAADGVSQVDATLDEETHIAETNTQFWRLLFFVLIVLVVLICLVLIFVILIIQDEGSEEKNEMSSKEKNSSSGASEVDVSQYLMDLRYVLLGADSFRLETNAPQLTATEWMAFADLPRLDLNISARLKQRFALATLYFGMGGEDWDLKGWLEAGRHECEWELVSCSEAGGVTQLSLGGSLGLTGSLLEEIGLLTSLTSLDFSNNRIEGSIPNLMYNLSNLVSLDLAENELVGHIDSSINNLRNLKVLKLGLNFFSGTLPEELKFLHDLRTFDIYKNPLHGNIWSLMQSWTKLEKFIIAETLVSGTIPSHSMKNMSSLREVYMSETLTEGTIPTEIGELSSLVSFRAGSSPLHGSIPSEIGRLGSLELLVLRAVNMEGESIPTEIGMCSSLIWIFLSQTYLSGTLPSELGNLSGLQVFSASYNNLEGTIPKDFSHLGKLRWLDLEVNTLMSGTMPTKLCDYLEGGRMTCSISCHCCLDYSFECTANEYGALKGYEIRIH